MTDKDKQFLDDVRRVMDDSVRDLDAGTLSRLAKARNQALDRKARARRKAFVWGTPAAGLAAAVIVLALVLRPGPTTPVEESYISDIDILASEEGVEFYEDMEFYQWLSDIEGKSDEDISHGRGSTPVSVADGERRGGRRHHDHDGRAAEHGDARISRHVRG